MVLSGIVALFSIPLIAGWGKLADNPSLLPGNYGAGLAIILAMTWVFTGVVIVRSRRRHPAESDVSP